MRLCAPLLLALAPVLAVNAAEDNARARLERIAEAMGVERLVAAGGITVHGHGTRDLAARLQGRRADVPEPHPLRTTLAADLVRGRLSVESVSRANSDAEEALRFVYADGEETLLADLVNARAFRIGPDEENFAGRHRNTVPHLLLRRLLEDDVVLAATQAGLSARLPDGELLTLRIEDDRLVEVAVETDVALLGPVTVSWTFEGYRELGGPWYPSGHALRLGERTLDRVEYSQVRLGPPDEHWFGPPAGIAPPPPPEPAAASDAAPDAPATERSPLRPVAEGVWLFANARGGFHPLVVEQAGGLLLVDAPAGWHELQVLPPAAWAGEGGGDAVGRRLLAALGEQFPDTPVRKVVLTHHHNDHAGGILPFIEAGAEVLATPATLALLEQLALPRLTAPLRDAARLTPVRGRLTVADATRPVELIDVGANPHAEGMLVAYLPSQRLLYQSDLFEPLSPANFPSLERMPVMAWFVAWLDRTGLAVDEVLAIHGRARVSEENLERVRSF